MAKRRRTRPAPPARVVGRARTSSATALGGTQGLSPLVLGLVVGAVVLAVGIVAFALISGGGRPNHSCGQLLQPQTGATVENPIVTPSMGFGHVGAGSRLSYADCPPASGPHYSQAGLAPVAPGFYRPDANIGPGSWIHNLEHGYVVALYRCVDGTCPSEEDLSDLRRFVLEGPSTPTAAACGYQSKVLAARFDDMATPFAMVAWERVLLLDAFDVSVALHFANRWIDASAREPGQC